MSDKLKRLLEYQANRINELKSRIENEVFSPLEKENFSEELELLEMDYKITKEGLESDIRFKDYIKSIEEKYLNNLLSNMTEEEKKGEFKDEDYQSEVDNELSLSNNNEE